MQKSSTLSTASTVKIECMLETGDSTTGTGFFCDLDYLGEGILTVLVTNKHVIKNTINCEIDIPVIYEDGIEGFETIMINDHEEKWVLHEEPEIDLCVLVLAQIIDAEYLLENNIRLNFHSIHLALFPNEKLLDSLEAIEEVIMIGYPDGIMDEANIKPITRKGITATHPNIDYEDSPEFLIDVPCFEGSSGSPVFLYNQGSWIDDRGQTIMGDRIYLLGVLYAGYDKDQKGNLVKTTINKMKMEEMKIHLNLGIVVKVKKLFDFRKLLILE